MIYNKNILDLEARRKIYNFIDKNQGLHIREISRRINIPYTTLKYHLKYLKKLNLITEKRESGYKRVYAQEKLGTLDKEILALLRQKTSCRIFLYLLFSLACSRIELSKELEIPPDTVKYHLEKMMEMGILEKAPTENGNIYVFPEPEKDNLLDRKPVGREVFYRRKNAEVFSATWKILIAHKHSLPDEKFIDAYLDYLNEIDRPMPKKIRDKDTIFSNVIDPFIEFFKPPFCT